MNLVPLSKVFIVRYGVNLELNSLDLNDDGINFVSRTSKNNGVSARVNRLADIKPIPAGMITVSGGGSVLEAFLQSSEFYSGRDLFYLESKVNLSVTEKLIYCSFIKANQYRYSYGRQANKTLKGILIPSTLDVANIAEKISIPNKPLSESIFKKKTNIKLNFNEWKPFRYEEIFFIERGVGPRKNTLTDDGETLFISASELNNGLTGWADHKAMHKANVISVVRNGNSVASAFYQDMDFCSTEDVHIFKPKFKLNKFTALFLCTLIKKEKYRFNYGRKWGIARMNESIIKLPVTDTGKPDWEFMENYIKSLPYSSNLSDDETLT